MMEDGSSTHALAGERPGVTNGRCSVRPIGTHSDANDQAVVSGQTGASVIL